MVGRKDGRRAQNGREKSCMALEQAHLSRGPSVSLICLVVLVCPIEAGSVSCGPLMLLNGGALNNLDANEARSVCIECTA